ncbi:MAG: VacJ family lipoprotein, partial [Nitrospira sp.]|nr:VacJ family lipoprotein [Nitrospira sp.]
MFVLALVGALLAPSAQAISSTDFSSHADTLPSTAVPRVIAFSTLTEEPGDPPSSSDEPYDPFAEAGELDIEEYDPWEPLNTKIFEFNRQVDRWILKPVATGYNL